MRNLYKLLILSVFLISSPLFSQQFISYKTINSKYDNIIKDDHRNLTNSTICNLHIDTLSSVLTWIDSSLIANPDLKYYVFLDNIYIETTTDTFSLLPYMNYNSIHEACVKSYDLNGIIDSACLTFTSGYLATPRDLDGETFDDAVHIWWKFPRIPDTTTKSRDLWDSQFLFPCTGDPIEYGVESDGNFIFTANSTNNQINQYDIDGTLISSFTIAGIDKLYDLAYNPNTGYFFGSNGSSTLYALDFYVQSIIYTITAPINIKTIAYDSYWDDVFYGCSWNTDIVTFDETGNVINTFPTGSFTNYSGFAYDAWSDGGPYLWGITSLNNQTILVQIDANTGIETYNINISPIVGESGIPGGLFTQSIFPGIITLGGILQDKIIFGLELFDFGSIQDWIKPANVLGYNVYRNDSIIGFTLDTGNDTIHYYDQGLNVYDTYIYNTTAIYDMAPYSMPGDTGESAYEGPMVFQGPIIYGIMPFTEQWNSGSFDLNQWEHDDEWTVNGQIGNPEPCAQFQGNFQLTDYSSELTSFIIDGMNIGDPYIDGTIWLDFDYKLENNNPTGDEFLSVYIKSEGLACKKFMISNSVPGNQWVSKHINISDRAFGEFFQIIFEAHGITSTDINSWFIDNISAYRTCPSPRNLDYSTYMFPFEADIFWEPPSIITPYLQEWISWDDGINIHGIGLTGGGTFSVASHWDPDMLIAYLGSSITKIRFYIYDNVQGSSYTLKIWEGPLGETLLYEDSAVGINYGMWYEHIVDPPVNIDISKELWFGYAVNQPDGENPASFDGGPGVIGYGDMINLGSWEPMSNYGFDLNWNLQAFITSNKCNTKDCNSSKSIIGYNVYMEEQFHAFTTDTFYHFIPDSFGNYRFEVGAVFQDCESDTLAGPIFIDIFESIDESSLLHSLRIYPNPVRDILYIQSKQAIIDFQLFNLHGHQLLQTQPNQKSTTINTSSFKNGIYTLRILLEGGDVVVRKVIVNRNP